MKYKEFFEKYGRIRFKYAKPVVYTQERGYWGLGWWRDIPVKDRKEEFGYPIGMSKETHPSLEEIYQMFKDRLIADCSVYCAEIIDHAS